MILPKGAVLEYQTIYKKVFGKDISYAEAVEKGTELIKLFQLIYKPIKKEWVKVSPRFQQRRSNNEPSI